MSLNHRQPQDLVTETSNLLSKSLSNTSLASHGDIQKDLEDQLQSIRKHGCDRTTASAYKRNLLLLFFGALSALLVLGFVFESAWSDERIESFDSSLIGGDGLALSLLDPVRDLNVATLGRSRDDPSFPSYYYGSDNDSNSNNRKKRALPTNAWYQNLLQIPSDWEPTNLQRVYPGPYLLDFVGIIPGQRIHANDIFSSDVVMQLTFNERFGLTLGATESISSRRHSDGDKHTKRYKVLKTTDLGITLEWEATKMRSNIVKGMSYVTMEYEKKKHGSSDNLLPTIAAESEWQNPIRVDGKTINVDCSQKLRVENDIELYFEESDYSWMVFFSEPVYIRCSVEKGRNLLQVVEYDNTAIDGHCSSPAETLVVRAALINQCANGSNPDSCRHGMGYRLPDEPKMEEYVSLLRSHVDAYPGPDTSFSYVMPDEEGDNRAEMIFDWDTRSMSDLCRKSDTSEKSSRSVNDEDLLVFAIPHQMDRLPSNALPNHKRYCKSSLTGPACLVLGNEWVIPQELPEINFQAKRPPKPEFIPTLAESLSKDIEFQIPDYFRRGAGDTYFSGKILAKLARIVLIAEEVETLCGEKVGADYLEFCQTSTRPNGEQIEGAIRHLREGVEVWINGTAETPLVYDTSWGGVVSCGCYMEGTQCRNRFPNCPGFADPGLNFGNGFYNDHHFHYGYHIFAAAVVAHYDRVWGMDNFENVLLLVRDIANPSESDTHFPSFRHKDWYQGSSWASGIAYPAYLNGNNQESSSEAISAYEGVALFGQVMTGIWQDVNHTMYAETSKRIGNVGRLLAGTELVSAKRYWHIPEDTNGKNAGQRIYPEQYKQSVVGILWQTMAQFGTYFGTAPYLPIGIQLLPLTPISEERDSIDWMNAIYEPLTQSCANDFKCTESGWSILQLSTLATVGYAVEAASKLKEVPDEAFENAGGNGHSRSNTLWYIATRPNIENPIPMVRYDKRGEEDFQPKASYELKNCYMPDTCTKEVLDRYAGAYTCRDRISWMIHSEGLPEWQACWRVAGLEFLNICGPCNPHVVVSTDSEDESDHKAGDESKEELPRLPIPAHTDLKCPPCTETECNSDLNRCPIYEKTFVCTQGTNKGDCSGDSQIWSKGDQCNECCEMTECLGLKDHEAQKFTKDANSSCPPCKPEVCYGKLNLCQIHSAPYLCTGGLNTGGCSPHPWDTSDGECTECCEIKPDC